MERMEFRPSLILSEVAENNCSPRMTRGREIKVPSNQNGTLEFRIATSASDIDISGIREIPQDTLSEASVEIRNLIAIIIVHSSSVHTNIPSTQNVDKDGLPLAFWLKSVRSCRGDSAISFVDLENLDVVSVVAIKCGSSVPLRDTAVGREGLPVLRLLVENILHLDIFSHVVVGHMSNAPASLPTTCTGDCASFVDDIASL